MPGIRLDRFLASTAMIILLSATAGGTLAEQMSRMDAGAATTPPAARRRRRHRIRLTRPKQPMPAAAAVQATKNEPAVSTIAPPAAAVGGDEVPIAAPPATRPGEPVAAPPATTLAEADAAIAEQMHSLANGKFDRIIGNKNDRTTIDAFYSGRNYAPLWITDGKANSRAKAAIAYLGRVDADGLDPADYPVPDFAALTDPAALAEAEIRLTTSVTAYVHHAQVGRIHWSRVSGDIFYDQKPPDPADILASLMETKDVGEALAAYEPPFPAYLALKAKLAEVRVGKVHIDGRRIPNGPTLKVGMHDERVPTTRAA